jgi:Ca2+-binding EF-hand superfamily protein
MVNSISSSCLALSVMDRPMPRSLKEEQVKEIKDVFDLFDIDGMGPIDPQELQLTRNTLGYGSEREEIQSIIHEIEKCPKWSMNFPEFLKIE